MDAKGAGSENMGKHAMLKPADGLEGAKEFVLQAVAESGPNACPPGIIGVGIGGNFEMSAVIAKRALMRKVGQPSSDPQIAELEAELYEKCNALGLGPEALGGTQTVLAVHVETMPTHIASLPVAVNIEVPRAPDRLEGDLRCPSRSWTTVASGSRRRCPTRTFDCSRSATSSSSGPVYAARDAAHKRMVEMLDRGEDLPFDIAGQIVYYVGPTPSAPATSRVRRARPPRAGWTAGRPVCSSWG